MSMPNKVGDHFIILFLYVDDLILTSSDPTLLKHLRLNLKKKFEMIDLGNFHYFLSLKVLQCNEGIFLSQSKYSCNLLHCFHMEYYKLAPSPFHSRVKLTTTCTTSKVDATLYLNLVGILLYLTHTHHVLKVIYCLIDDQVVDIFKKELVEVKFTKL